MQHSMRKTLSKLIATSLSGALCAILVMGAVAHARPSQKLPELQPHPILGELKVRQALAYCTDKAALQKMADPKATPDQRPGLLMDSFLSTSHPFYAKPANAIAYDPAKGQALLDEAGWAVDAKTKLRSKEGKRLALTVMYLTNPAREKYVPVWINQLKACGFQIIKKSVTRERIGVLTEVGAGPYAHDFDIVVWHLELTRDTKFADQYACAAEPSAKNAWYGGNVSGWCNAKADRALPVADDAKASEAKRKEAYAILQNEHAADLPDLPLFAFSEGIDGNNVIAIAQFNLKTYQQRTEILPDAPSAVTTTGLEGNAIEIVVPAKAVKQPTTLVFTALISNTSLFEGAEKYKLGAFKLSTEVAGVPQAVTFAQPISLTVSYDPAKLGSSDTKALDLWLIDDKTGQLAQPSQGCPRNKQALKVDTAKHTVTVSVCRVGEYALWRGQDK